MTKSYPSSVVHSIDPIRTDKNRDPKSTQSNQTASSKTNLINFIEIFHSSSVFVCILNASVDLHFSQIKNLSRLFDEGSPLLQPINCEKIFQFK